MRRDPTSSSSARTSASGRRRHLRRHQGAASTSSAPSRSATRRSPRGDRRRWRSARRRPGTRPVAEIMYVDFIGLSDGADRQPGRQDALHVRRQDHACRWSSAHQQGGGRGNAAQHSPVAGGLVRPHPRPEGRACRPPRPTPRACSRRPSATTTRSSSSSTRCCTSSRARSRTATYTVPLGVADVKRAGTRRHGGRHPARMVQRSAGGGRGRCRRRASSVEVIDPRTVSPLDCDTIVESVKKTGRLIVAHQAYEQRRHRRRDRRPGSQEAAFDYLDAPIQRVCRQKRADPLQRDPRASRPARQGRDHRGRQEGPVARRSPRVRATMVGSLFRIRRAAVRPCLADRRARPVIRPAEAAACTVQRRFRPISLSRKGSSLADSFIVIAPGRTTPCAALRYASD